MSYTKQQIADICRSYGSQLTNTPSTIDGTQVLWGLSGNESSFGANCNPRHEPAFDVGGIFFNNSPVQRLLVAKFGKDAACSYGPWQLLFCNAPPEFVPSDMLDLAMATNATVRFMNIQLGRFKPTTLNQIAEIWNDGKPLNSPDAGVQRYVAEFIKNYSVAMPPPVTSINA